MVKDKIKETAIIYTDGFKAEIDRRVQHYLRLLLLKIISPGLSKERILLSILATANLKNTICVSSDPFKTEFTK